MRMSKPYRHLHGPLRKCAPLAVLLCVLLPKSLLADPSQPPTSTSSPGSSSTQGLSPTPRSTATGSAPEDMDSEDQDLPSTSRSEARDEVVFQLPQIIVEGKRPEAPPSLIVRKVDIEDIEASNSHTVGEALTYVPGVNVQYGGTSGDARAWIRGYRDRDVLVLFDGIPVASGFEGTIDLNEIAVQRVASVDVIKSAPSVIYGTNAVGGVISVVPETGISGSFLDGSAGTG